MRGKPHEHAGPAVVVSGSALIGGCEVSYKKRIPALPDFDDIADYDFLDVVGVASATECTGLMPTPPIKESDVDSYTDLYDIPQPGHPIF